MEPGFHNQAQLYQGLQKPAHRQRTSCLLAGTILFPVSLLQIDWPCLPRSLVTPFKSTLSSLCSHQGP
jgi:hypothetical protein